MANLNGKWDKEGISTENETKRVNLNTDFNGKQDK